MDSQDFFLCSLFMWLFQNIKILKFQNIIWIFKY